MKRKSMLLVSIILGVSLCLALSGCGGDKTQQAATDDTVYTISIGSVSAETLPEVRAAYEFKKVIEEKSGGRIQVSVHPNGELGGDRQMVESVALGTLDMVLSPSSVFTSYDERFGILDMPFSFSSADKAFAAVDGELGAYLNKIMDEKAGMYNLGYMLNGVRHMINDTKPINEPADMKGLKMRIMESPIFVSMFEALGANPTPMSFGEVYTSLQQKAINGFECSANFIYDMKFYEVQKYYSLTAHTISMLCVPINKAKYDSLPDDLKTIFDEAVQTCLIDYQRKITVDEDADYMAKLKDSGMEINEITPENHQKFVDAVAPMYKEYEDKLGTEIFDLLRKYQ